MNRSTPGLPVHHHLLEFTQTHVHWVGDAIQPSHPLSSPSPPAPNPSQHQGLLQWVNSSHFLYCLAILNVIWTPHIFNTKKVNATHNRKKEKYLNWKKLLPSLNIIHYSNKKANHIDIHWGGAGIGLWFMLYLVLRHAHLFGMSLSMPLFHGFMEVYSLFWYHDPFLSFFFFPSSSLAQIQNRMYSKHSESRV